MDYTKLDDLVTTSSEMSFVTFSQPVFTIPYKDGYDSSDESYMVTQFKIRQVSVFKIADHIIPKL